MEIITSVAWNEIHRKKFVKLFDIMNTLTKFLLTYSIYWNQSDVKQNLGKIQTDELGMKGDKNTLH